MSGDHGEIGASSGKRRRLSLSTYVHRRNGVPLGAAGSLRNMLERSLGASSFAGFWRYWNPIWGYALARFVNAPLRRFLPSGIAVFLTFVVCGVVHDLVVSALLGTLSVVCTLMFCLLGVGVVIAGAMKMDLSGRSWWLRACVNLIYIAVCVGSALALEQALKL